MEISINSLPSKVNFHEEAGLVPIAQLIDSVDQTAIDLMACVEEIQDRVQKWIKDHHMDPDEARIYTTIQHNHQRRAFVVSCIVYY